MPADHPATADRRVPVTLVTGFLGAGKTTLVNRMLAAGGGRRIAVVVNDFARAGIDGDLIDAGAEEIVELSDGCLCCALRGDLVRALREIARRSGIDHVVIETTGLADPAPVIQTFAADQITAARFRLDGVVALADTLNFPDQAARYGEALRQVALADHVVLTKTALPRARPAATAALIARVNPLAAILSDDAPARDLFALGSFDAARVAGFLAALPPGLTLAAHGGTSGLGSVSLSLSGPVDAAALETWLSELVARDGADILRIKGVLRIKGNRRLVIQGVHRLIEATDAGTWPGSEAGRDSRLVLIGTKLDAPALDRAFAATALSPVLQEA